MPVSHYPDYVEFSASPNQAKAKLSQNPQLAAAEREKLQIYEETWFDIEQRGFRQCSVVRLCPWSLTLDGPAHNCRKIPGVPIDPDMFNTQQPRLVLDSGYSIPYVHHVISVPYVTVGTRFRGASEADSTAETKASIDMPIILGKDMAQQQNQYRSQGGIFAYESNELPQDAAGNWLTTASKGGLLGWMTNTESLSLPDAAQQAFSRMITHMNATMDQATAANLSGEKELMREIRGNRFRECVQYLMNIGTITQAPKWFMERSDSHRQKFTTCPMCPARVEIGRVKCQCGYILDPFEAYGKLYDETMPGGTMTARRMTKAQLETLSLYPRVKPLQEWLADQNEDAATEPEKDKKGKK